jgi:hypothetical protein
LTVVAEIDGYADGNRVCTVFFGGGNSVEVPLARWLGLVALAAIAAACATPAARETSTPQVRAPDRFIYVTAQELPGECYRDLGTVKFDEPFSAAAVDEDDTAAAKQLRVEALKNYPTDADAVIKVQKEQNDAGTTVTVTGEAVQLQKHETVVCAIRQAPGVLDKSAALAAGGIAGAALEGSVTSEVQGAENGAAMGVAGVGKYQLNDAQREASFQDTEIKNQLSDQRHQINQLLSTRARLQQCQQEETPLSECDVSEVSTNNGAADDKDPQWNGSTYELQRQIQEQQLYIGQLKDQVSDIRRTMGGGD